jgi:hypothetical protein
MALGSTMKTALKRIADALDRFAAEQGWKPDEYQILFRVSHGWGRIRVFFIVKDFGNLSRQEAWVRIWDYLENSFKNGPDIGYSVGLSVRDRSQVNQGGAYSIPPGYVDHKELLLIPSASD